MMRVPARLKVVATLLAVVLAGLLVSTSAQARQPRADSAAEAAYQAILDAEVEARVETALYRQRSLLDAALATVQPSDPKRIQLYFLGVAGDGTQEVFRREVDFVRAQFDQRFGTAGHSLALINSRTTVGSVPLATRTSLQESLQTLARRMDREKDILFVFLTSHGSRDHRLLLAEEGLAFADLPAQTLATVLRQQQIRWKVIVISACYAGGFIAPLADDHTLIITAARADRSSFGCADDNDFTYFGRAFFKESLPRADSFEQAFRQASVLVHHWELEDRKRAPRGATVAHSYPQMSAPSPISAYLARWRLQNLRD